MSASHSSMAAAAPVRRLAYVALAVAFAHIVFGAIVRISGSGMGCGDHWPKCYGYWIPPMTRPDLIIEISHRYLAIALFVAIAALVAAAWRRRAEPGVGGRGGVLRAALLGVALWFAPALFGAVTVFLGNPPWATVVHKLLAATLLAVLAVATIRAGGLGGASALSQRAAGRFASAKAFRGATVAAALALLAVVMGAMTAKIANAAIACRGFPFCGEGSLGGGAQHVQLTHRVIAYLLAFHVLALFFAFSRRRETPAVVAAAQTAFGVVLLQIGLGAAMVLGGFPPVLRSLHQATGMALWLTTFVMAYLARIALEGARDARRATANDVPSRGPAPLSGVPSAESNA
jgi:cytochrome c oxidase assembly protein subunit 15